MAEDPPLQARGRGRGTRVLRRWKDREVGREAGVGGLVVVGGTHTVMHTHTHIHTHTPSIHMHKHIHRHTHGHTQTHTHTHTHTH